MIDLLWLEIELGLVMMALLPRDLSRSLFLGFSHANRLLGRVP